MRKAWFGAPLRRLKVIATVIFLIASCLYLALVTNAKPAAATTPTSSSVAAGGETTCAVMADGKAYCWGDNQYGQIGDGTTTNRTVPTLVAGGHIWASISTMFDPSAGDTLATTCGITTAGDAYCWGSNTNGDVGDGTTTPRHTPTLVSGGYHWASLAVGAITVCGITTSGDAYCWGSDWRGELGDGSNGTTINPGGPTAVLGGYKWSSISEGNSTTCGVTTGNVGYCWGDNGNGQIGNGSGATNFDSPQPVSGNYSWSKITAGALDSCGITTTGVGYCWGRDDGGQLGDGGSTDKNLPAAVLGGHTWTVIVAGYSACGITTAGLTYCWGWNQLGGLGDGSASNQGAPALVQGGYKFTDLSDGWGSPTGGTICGLSEGNAVYCWGYNDVGQVGAGGTSEQNTPSEVKALTASDDPHATSAIPPGDITMLPANATPSTIDSGDTNPVELGTRFEVQHAGVITGIRFYKASTNTGTHTGYLWNQFAGQLATVTFSNETSSGWQYAYLATPVRVSPFTIYVVSYYAPHGHYSHDISAWDTYTSTHYFEEPTDWWSGTGPGNTGAYYYFSDQFPNQGDNSDNYYIDPIMQPDPAPQCPCTFFQPEETPNTYDSGDLTDYELGMEFRTFSDGYITGVRFLKGVLNTGAHTGHLWDKNGTLLASVSFSSETASGWQEANFSSPVAVTAYSLYTVSYTDPGGEYAATNGYFAADSTYFDPLMSRMPMYTVGAAGVYSTTMGAYPTTTFQSSAYWVDPVFSRTLPTAPASLAQYKSNGSTSIANGAWTNDANGVVFSATVTDPEGDQSRLCVENTSGSFASFASPTVCGDFVSSGQTAKVAISGLTDATRYRWQIKAQDLEGTYTAGYAAFNSGNLSYGYDISGPAGGTVYDGSSPGVEEGFNSGSLSSISCNWTVFTDTASGLASYDYSVGTSPGAADILGWTNVSASTTNATANALNLRTGQAYYCNVRGHDGVGNVGTTISSAGQQVAPTLSFNISKSALDLPELNSDDNLSSTQTLTLTTSTNAANGYTIQADKKVPLADSGGDTINDYASPASSPTKWADTGFGYTMSGGASVNAFGGGSKWAGFGTPDSPDTIVQHNGPISGSAISNEQETLTLKSVVSTDQMSGYYQTTIDFTCTPSY